MEEMIGRVASAVFDVIWPTQEWNMDESLCRAVSEAAARAAIEAMRFPVSASSVPGGLAIEESMFGSEDTVFHGAAKSFNAILDAALSTRGG